jgi:hypothetical protein
MDTIGIYLFRSVIWLTGFAIVYLIFLRNERFFHINRFYLIAGILISIFLPLFTIHYKVTIPFPDSSHYEYAPLINTDYTSIQAENTINSFAAIDIILFLYLSGVLLFATGLITKVWQLARKKNKAKIDHLGEINIIRTPETTSSFSFFNNIFINPSLDEIELEQILHHEIVHVQQKHWIDIMLSELLVIIQWFNPVVWLYTRFIRQNQEYLADAAALQKSSDPAIYKATLLNHIIGIPVVKLAHSFNYSLNAKRFNMMKNIIRSPYRKLKVLLILPVIASIFYSFAEPEYHYISSTENDMTVVEPPVIFIRELKGTIVNEDGKPLEGVKITVSGTSFGAVSDEKGHFEIGNVPDKESLIITYAGYKTLTLIPLYDSDMNIMMFRGSENFPVSAKMKLNGTTPEFPPLFVIDGVISDKGVDEIHPDDIARISVLKDKPATDKYGEEGKNGVVEITTKKIDSKGTQNTLSDVKVIGYANKPEIDASGLNRKIRIRNSKPSNADIDPLIVIDGIVTDIDVNDIDPLSIESIDVLKDEASINKYGEKGINGVIEIITKKKR